MEIYLLLLHQTMDVAEALTVQLRAIEIVAAHEKLAERRAGYSGA
jgi:hypothetical protein